MFIAPESYLNAMRFRESVWQPKHLVRKTPPVADIDPAKKYANEPKDPFKGNNANIVV